MMLSRQVLRARLPLILGLITIPYLLYSLHLYYPLLPPRHHYEYTATSFEWRNFPQHYPLALSDVFPLPIGEPRQFNSIQFDFKSSQGDGLIQADRRDAVRAAFSKSWESYKKYAWGADELMPVTAGRKDGFGGYAATLVDALDTLWIMGFKQDFQDAVALVAKIDWMNTKETALNLFETTIRHLGGLLSAYDLSNERVLLDKAVELGDMLLFAFDTPNRMPGFWFDFEDAKNSRQSAGTNDPASSPSTLALEFTRLAQLTRQDKYYDAVYRVAQLLNRTQYQTKLPGMWPEKINFRDETAEASRFTLGAFADSLYEYLPKMAALTGGRDPMYENLYRGAMDAVQKHVLFRPMIEDPDADDILVAGTVHVEDGHARLQPESEHLACFAGGMFGFGGRLFDIAQHVHVGEQLARGCAWTYSAFPTGLGPEIFALLPCPSLDRCPWDDKRWRAEGDLSLTKGFLHAREPKYILRPEAVESLFLMWRITGNPKYRDSAWTMFQAIQNATETEYAYSAIADVRVAGETKKTDSMESFRLAETLKYLYLIFSSPDDISLDDWPSANLVYEKQHGKDAKVVSHTSLWGR